jgi:hypothetical protein
MKMREASIAQFGYPNVTPVDFASLFHRYAGTHATASCANEREAVGRDAASRAIAAVQTWPPTGIGVTDSQHRSHSSVDHLIGRHEAVLQDRSIRH